MPKQAPRRNTDTRRRRLHPVAADWEWQLSAACRGADSSLFFASAGETRRDRFTRESTAKALCARCPVRLQCQRHAVAVGEPYGLWGGLTQHELRDVTPV